VTPSPCVFTGAGDKAFCTGGNTKEYAEYYAGKPQEYRGYMRLFNDMVSGIIACDKPVICRVNGMRIGGGQEIGMACDFSIAQDLARFGQAGTQARLGADRRGDRLPPRTSWAAEQRDGFVRAVRAVFGAQGLSYIGMISEVVPALKVDGKFRRKPDGLTSRIVTSTNMGAFVHGKPKTGAAAAEGQALLKRGAIDLRLLDEHDRSAVHQAALYLPRLYD
jgi:6-oxo-cyclohex-1-ene-carbonyl-CoA hydrolase